MAHPLIERLAKPASRRRPLQLPEDAGAGLFVRILSARERLELEEYQSGKGKGDSFGYLARLIAVAVVDEAGQPAFALKQLASLADAEGDLVAALSGQVVDFNGMGPGSVADAKKN